MFTSTKKYGNANAHFAELFLRLSFLPCWQEARHDENNAAMPEDAAIAEAMAMAAPVADDEEDEGLL